jgi:NHL repeat-containing protein
MTNLRDRKTIAFQYVAAATLVVVLFSGQASAEQSGKQAIELGPGSAHPGTTGEVRLELEEFQLEGDPHACGIIWDLAVDEQKGELFVLCEPKRVGGVGEVRVFDRSGAYQRTIMPLNPTLPYSSVRDICDEVVREDGTELIVPKFDLSWGEPSFYGTFWDSHKKIALAPDGDLVISDLYRGKLMRMGPDGSLPEEGWNTGYAVHVGGARGSAIVNYLPFDSLRYPYFHFGPDGSLYVSGGQSSFESRYHHYNLEGGVNNPRYHFPVEGDRSGYVWKLGLKPGPKAEELGVVGGFQQASGIVVDGEHIVVADAGNSRLAVCTIDGEQVASITHYMDKGEKQPILDPTALAMDRDKCLYVLIGSQERPEDPRTERGVRNVQQALHAAAFDELPPPRKVIKLRNWKAPELLAQSAPVHTYVMQIAVDVGVSPPLVWVANGDGPGSLQQLSGKDLSLKAQWQDDGDTLSNPRQDSGMPILNIDPETGHVYVEDDARYRHKKFGTVYRLDQQGHILKTWDPYFIDIEESGLISPWGATNLDRGFPHPEEPLFLDSVFGRDGRVYRWKLGEDGISILRFDRAGKPLPFASTGRHELLVDAVPVKGRLYEKAHLRKQFTCWWDVYSGMDVDSEGNIYYAKKQDRYVESGMMLPNYALHRQLDVYDSNGELKRNALLDLTSVKGIQVDKEGCLYIVHIPTDGRPPEKRVDRAKAKAPKRYPMRPFAVSKFAPTGGEPLWSQPWDGDHGMGFIPPNPHCICSTHRVNQALDDKGYIYMATKYSVQVIDTETGDLVGEFGTYGNVDCKGKGSAYPHPELPFGSISSLAVWKDKLFVMDVLNRRLVKLNITYDPALKSAK